MSFHVLVVWRCWFRPSSDIPYTVTHFDPLVSWPRSYLRTDDMFHVEYFLDLLFFHLVIT